MSATSGRNDRVVERVRSCIAIAMAIPVADVPDDIGIGQPALWDSVAHIGLMCALAQEFALELPDDVIPELTSLHAIVGYIVATSQREA